MPAVADVVTPQEPEEPAIVQALPDQDPLLPDPPSEADVDRDVAAAEPAMPIDPNMLAEVHATPDAVATEPVQAAPEETADELDTATAALPEARVTVNVVDRESELAPFQVSKLVR
jgi:hypothetical protein